MQNSFTEEFLNKVPEQLKEEVKLKPKPIAKK